MGTYLNAFQRTVVGIITVIGTLGNCAFNALIRMTVHSYFLLFLSFANSIAQKMQNMHTVFTYFHTWELTIRGVLCIIVRENAVLRNLYLRAE